MMYGVDHRDQASPFRHHKTQGMSRCGLVAVRFETAKKTAAVGGCTARFLMFRVS